ncbi:hypothetical protein [Flavobacterium adhaerens]|uniref:hypothetical protein n=1 Tax=Flavobacterium adhaerens TaxID=3149043 RepID=UPI0032B47563
MKLTKQDNNIKKSKEIQELLNDVPDKFIRYGNTFVIAIMTVIILVLYLHLKDSIITTHPQNIWEILQNSTKK